MIASEAIDLELVDNDYHEDVCAYHDEHETPPVATGICYLRNHCPCGPAFLVCEAHYQYLQPYVGHTGYCDICPDVQITIDRLGRL